MEEKIVNLKDVNGDSYGNSINEVIAVPDPFNPGEFTNETLVDLAGNSIAALFSFRAAPATGKAARTYAPSRSRL